MNGFNKIDEIKFDDEGNLISVKGHIEPVKVIELCDMNKEFLSHRFDRETRKVMFWSQFRINYCGG